MPSSNDLRTSSSVTVGFSKLATASTMLSSGGAAMKKLPVASDRVSAFHCDGTRNWIPKSSSCTTVHDSGAGGCVRAEAGTAVAFAGRSTAGGAGFLGGAGTALLAGGAGLAVAVSAAGFGVLVVDGVVVMVHALAASASAASANGVVLFMGRVSWVAESRRETLSPSSTQTTIATGVRNVP